MSKETFILKFQVDGKDMGYLKNCGYCYTCESFLDAERFTGDKVKVINSVKENLTKVINGGDFETRARQVISENAKRLYWGNIDDIEKVSIFTEKI